MLVIRPSNTSPLSMCPKMHGLPVQRIVPILGRNYGIVKRLYSPSEWGRFGAGQMGFTNARTSAIRSAAYVSSVRVGQRDSPGA